MSDIETQKWVNKFRLWLILHSEFLNGVDDGGTCFHFECPHITLKERGKVFRKCPDDRLYFVCNDGLATIQVPIIKKIRVKGFKKYDIGNCPKIQNGMICVEWIKYL